MITLETFAIVTHQKGSWQWQDRHAISRYESGFTRDGRLVWKYDGTTDTKVKPSGVRLLRGRTVDPLHYGSLHNKEIPHSLHCRRVDVV